MAVLSLHWKMSNNSNESSDINKYVIELLKIDELVEIFDCRYRKTDNLTFWKIKKKIWSQYFYIHTEWG